MGKQTSKTDSRTTKIQMTNMERLWHHQSSRTIYELENICMKGRCWCTK